MSKEADNYLADKYFDDKRLESYYPKFDYSNFELVTSDSYSDKEIAEAIKRTGAEEELMCTAINTAIVGYGNKNYGVMKFKGELVNIEEIYKLYDVKIYLDRDSGIGPDILTPRRLQRFFRREIRKFLERNQGVYSYLFKKYSSHDEKFRHCVYPSSESYIKDKDEAYYLLEVYNNLDKQLHLNIKDRIMRVFNSRGILTMKECLVALEILNN